MQKLTSFTFLMVWAVVAQSAGSDIRYPREFTSPQGSVITHAPQIESWTGYEIVTGVSAIEVSLAAMGKPKLGSIRYVANTVTSLEEHTVTFYDIRLTQVSFPNASDAEAAVLEELVRDTLNQRQLSLPIELVLQYLDTSIIPTGPADGLIMTPPNIYFATTDSRLVIFDGEPMLQPIQKTDLQFAVNTNWDLFYVESRAMWYLLDGERWLSLSGRKLSGGWQLVSELPQAFGRLPSTSNWETVKKAVPAKPASGPLPQIFISEVPAELILTAGEPELEAIGSTGIRYVTNTKSDVFNFEGTYYYLVSGRWFQSSALSGGWQPVSKLPEAFAEIPPDGLHGDVLVSVPGTVEAKMAVLEATIPRKANISRNYQPPVNVAYTDGKPQFERIAPTDVYQAVNTPQTVLNAADRYYLCYNAAWFVSEAPEGPWKVVANVPKEIYTIPTSSPAYNCTHVYAYDSNDDYVTTGYNSGYFNVYTSYTVIYGSGYYYRPYYYYPYYYGYPRSYGGANWYNPRNGNFGSTQRVYGPYGGASRTAIYNPETGTYARGRSVWSGDEMARQGVAYNPSNGTGVYTNRYANEDGAWGRSLVKRDDRWVATQTERQGNTATTDFKTSGGASGTLNREVNDGTMTGSGTINRNGNAVDTQMARNEDGVARRFSDQNGNSGGYVKNSEGDLYAGKNGDVYKREDGQWSKRGEGGWEQVEPGGGEKQNDFSLHQSDLDRMNSRAEAKDYKGMVREAQEGAAQGPERVDSTQERYDARSEMGRNSDRGTRAERREYDRSNNGRVDRLERNHTARQRGFDRHNRRMNRGGMGGRRGGRRR